MKECPTINHPLQPANGYQKWVAIARFSRQFLRQFRENTYQSFTSCFNSIMTVDEPKVFQKCNRTGNVHFEVYDPKCRQRMTFGSEQEVRIWLEQRYYQPPQ